MINSSVVISGEASETDSEDDTNPKHTNMSRLIQGAVITGEDSESDNELDGSISSAASVLTQPPQADKTDRKFVVQQNESLLHKKLRESNAQLYTDVESFCQNAIDQARKNLSTIDQQLLKSQITLQTAVTSLRSLNVNSTLIKDKLQSILSSKFISNINIDSK